MVPEGPPARANPARGIALIATALILGLFVLRQGFETIDDESIADGAPANEEAEDGSEEEQPPADDGGGGGGGGDEPPAPVEEEPLGPSELTVRVVNTTSVVGTAANWTCVLESNQYNTVEATNAAGERDQQPATVVMHEQGLEQEAAQLAQAIGEGVAAEPMPQDPPLDAEGQPLMAEGTQLLVILGTDRAGAEEPCPGG